MSGVSVPIKNWLTNVKRKFDVKSYSRAEERYIHYKQKLTRLVSSYEDEFVKLNSQKKGKIGVHNAKKKKERIKRVSFRLSPKLASDSDFKPI